MVGAWLGAAVLTTFLLRVAPPLLGAGALLLLHAGLASALAAFALLSLLHRGRASAWRVLECVIFALPWVAALSSHRQGHLERPAGLVEAATRLGLDPFRLFAGLGLILGAMLVLLLASRRGLRAANALIVWAIAAGCLALLPAERMARLATQLEEPPSEQVSQSQKADTPVAVAVFYQDYNPELGVYHFAPQAPAEGELPEATGVHYRMAELVPQPDPLVLGWSAQLTPASVAHEEAFARIYEVRSQVVSRPLSELLDITSSGLEPGAGPYRELVESVVPEPERALPLRAALRLKLWMEQNRPQGAEGPEDSVEGCLRDGRSVGQKTYTEAAQALLASLGLRTRLVQGFAVRADQRGEGSFLLLTQQDQRWWLELWLDGVGWLVLDLYPLDGPNDSAGPQNQELQRRLGEMARARETSPDIGPLNLGTGAVGFFLFLLIVGMGGHGIRLVRQLRVHWCRPERLPVWGYLAVLDRLAEVGELRRAGETRHEFAMRLKDRVPSLEALTLLHQRAALGPPGTRPDNIAPLLTACLRERAAAYPRPLRWLGSCHPFAWMKVL